ncbi:MAG: hypothetical protein AXA67_07740 [Methylothermaceae bacteria B42]|nr:MAG: hypothetical protein AXA67_07740 [Methylothermaceae bacteria B42]HHJ40084.1 tetraacyldisaccharide 4'-kinase [Methylothermaceae bacterium]
MSFQGRLARWLEDLWYGNRPVPWGLKVCAFVFGVLIQYRRWFYTLFPSQDLAIPVIVVGNLTVGGTGKTPLAIWLARFLNAQGIKPGVICRGHGGDEKNPIVVTTTSDPSLVGDEAVLLARRCGCPVVAGRKRRQAAQWLVNHYPCQVILSDDGLQHYALPREIEIIVIDGVRRFGNGRLLPAGPLREPPGRLKEADLIVSNGRGQPGEWAMGLKGRKAVNLCHPSRVFSLEAFQGRPVHAVAGIGHPQRFFQDLQSSGLEVIPHVFPDHHRYNDKDICFSDGLPVLMTEKDAVKCFAFARENHWYVPVETEIDEKFGIRILQLLRKGLDGQKTA